MFETQRRTFLRLPILAAATIGLQRFSDAEEPRQKTTQIDPRGYFTVDRRNDRWWMIQPDGSVNFSLGLNHIDPEPLRQGEDDRLWQQRYGGDVQRWLAESVRKNLLDWGFNTVGLTADVVALENDDRRLGGGLSPAQLRSLQLPYGYLLPFAQPDPETGELPPNDYLGQPFARWCDRIARQHCAAVRDDRQLIGYWSAERPDWSQARFSSRSEMANQATGYYQTIRTAIRRYDPHHLILGDRYDASRSLSATVVRAALPHVDLLSVDCSGDAVNVHRQLSKMAQLFDRPILVADHAIDRQPHNNAWPPQENRFHDPRGYRRTVEMLTAIPQVVGYHLCGGYLPSQLLRRGLMDAQERPDRLAIEGIRTTNAAVKRWVADTGDSPLEPPG
ncbi:hypothetical protein [Rosistilla oblonga]|uniref:hypothetical protein n=1 Tax=Rosistilla oblonga TaxID=2527990 RepID=UPI003A97884F